MPLLFLIVLLRASQVFSSSETRGLLPQILPFEEVQGFDVYHNQNAHAHRIGPCDNNTVSSSFLLSSSVYAFSDWTWGENRGVVTYFHYNWRRSRAVAHQMGKPGDQLGFLMSNTHVSVPGRGLLLDHSGRPWHVGPHCTTHKLWPNATLCEQGDERFVLSVEGVRVDVPPVEAVVSSANARVVAWTNSAERSVTVQRLNQTSVIVLPNTSDSSVILEVDTEGEMLVVCFVDQGAASCLPHRLFPEVVQDDSLTKQIFRTPEDDLIFPLQIPSQTSSSSDTIVVPDVGIFSRKHSTLRIFFEPLQNTWHAPVMRHTLSDDGMILFFYPQSSPRVTVCDFTLYDMIESRNMMPSSIPTPQPSVSPSQSLTPSVSPSQSLTPSVSTTPAFALLNSTPAAYQGQDSSVLQMLEACVGSLEINGTLYACTGSFQGQQRGPAAAAPQSTPTPVLAGSVVAGVVGVLAVVGVAFWVRTVRRHRKTLYETHKYGDESGILSTETGGAPHDLVVGFPVPSAGEAGEQAGNAQEQENGSPNAAAASQAFNLVAAIAKHMAEVAFEEEKNYQRRVAMAPQPSRGTLDEQ